MHGYSLWAQLGFLGVAFVLSTAIGVERQLRQKSAGMRTYALVGVGSALFMLISKYGFFDVLATNLVRVDPARIAAQVVTGIGFIGAGLIVMRRGTIRGLTTAASMWVTCAIGMAAGAGMLVPALAVTAAYFIAIMLFPWLTRRVPRLRVRATHHVAVLYHNGTGALRDIVGLATELGYTINGFAVATNTATGLFARLAEQPGGDIVPVELEVSGRADTSILVAQLAGLEHVVSVTSDELSE